MYNLDKEINEAIYAGERALNSLRAARKELQSAGNWGLADMFGGCFIINMIKHSKMDNAEAYMQNARNDLMHFQRELRDVTIHANLSINCGDFLRFTDIISDSLIIDWMVQSKINQAKQQIDQVIPQIERILRDLRRY